MDTTKVIFYLVLAGLAVFCVFANTWPNRAIRIWLSMLYMVLLLVCCLFSGILGKSGYMPTIGFGFAWPFFVSILFNQLRPVASIAFSRPRINKFLLVLGGLGIAMAIPVYIYISDFPATIATHASAVTRLDDVARDEYIEFVRRRLNYPLVMLPMALILAIRVFQKTVFSMDGIFRYINQIGILEDFAPWSDFKSYRWTEVPGKNPYFELVLEPKRYKWGWPKLAKYELSIQDKERLDPILAQKLFYP